MSDRTLVLTGPVGSLESWAHAARRGGWTPTCVPVIELRPREPGEPVPATDWLLVTSQSALPYLEAAFAQAASPPAAVVGERSAAWLAERGVDVVAGPAPDSESLWKEWRPLLRPGARVLWPRGPHGGGWKSRLAEVGAELIDPLAYNTVEIPGPALPEAEAVLFASPSGLRAALARGITGKPRSVAIGPTTEAALRETVARFSSVERLDAPTADALERWCRRT